MWPKPTSPRILWNISPSAPTGFYWLMRRPPSLGALAVTRLPNPFLGLAGARGYLPVGTLLIKRVAGAAGDVVCRHGAVVTINRRIVAYARTADAAARLLPRWSGCARLNAAQVFVLSPRPDSFDSRYFGPLAAALLDGTAVALLTR